MCTDHRFQSGIAELEIELLNRIEEFEGELKICPPEEEKIILQKIKILKNRMNKLQETPYF